MALVHHLLLTGALALGAALPGTPGTTDAPLPQRLSETGLIRPGSAREVQPGHLVLSPQYPLWSDGAAKRRWMSLPAGTAIDGSQPDAWQFPPGTRLWKEFSHAGRPVETRFIERLADGRWRYATYVWSTDGSDALLAPAEGIAGLPVAGAPGGRYDVPARTDCAGCHESAAVPVLGASALQLAADLPALVASGRLRHLPTALLATPPQIAADSPTERAALGYLHANCGHCHNDSDGRVPVRLMLAQSAADPVRSRERLLASAVAAPSRWRAPGAPGDAVVIAPGRPEASVLVQRMHSREERSQMPPLGTRLADAEGLALVERWITHDLPPRKEPTP